MNSEQAFSESPLVSVIIPAYNAEVFIERTLKSVLSQTYQNLEVLVVDDGSQDRTAEIVQSIAEQDQRVILLQQINSGVAAARNLGIEKSQGEFIAPIDADDIWYPENIEKQVQCFLDSDPSVGVVYSWSVDIDENDSLTGGFRAAQIEGEVYTTLVCHNFLGNASASIIRRDCIEKVGSYKCNFKGETLKNCADWELYLRLAEHYQFRVVPDFLVGYRKLADSMSNNCTSVAKFHNLILQDIQQKHSDIHPFIYRWARSSLYMYLAHQSSRGGRHKETLFWLYKAVRADLATPFFRIGLYILSIKSIFKIVGDRVISLVGLESKPGIPFKQGINYKQKVINLADIKKSSLTINLSIKTQNLLHGIASKRLTIYPKANINVDYEAP